MLDKRFGIEIEFTGITRRRAAEITAEHLGGRVNGESVTAPDGRIWQFKYDGSIRCQRKANGSVYSEGSSYSVELVSPILTYRQDIDTLQGLIRKLRKAGGMTNDSCGIHIHLDGADHTPRSLVNFIKIVASKQDLLFDALQIKSNRQRYCKKIEESFVEKIESRKPKTFAEIENIWYDGYYERRTTHYHESRYHFLNLHSFFNGHRTVELRGFNSELHAGKVRTYIVLALAINNQALVQRTASSAKVQTENKKFAMRTYLNRIGFIGDEFENCRKHLTDHLTGSAAWRHGVA